MISKHDATDEANATSLEHASDACMHACMAECINDTGKGFDVSPQIFWISQVPTNLRNGKKHFIAMVKITLFEDYCGEKETLI
jgi:hypothetical protein